jgi:hypothetical protein
MEKARVIKVIETVSKKGNGTKKDPVRYVIQYWDLNGKLLSTHDTINEGYFDETMLSASSDNNS